LEQEKKRKYYDQLKLVSDLKQKLATLASRSDADRTLYKTISDSSTEAQRLADEMKSTIEFDRISKYCTSVFNIDQQTVTCSLIKEFTLFGVLVAASGNYEKYYPPVTAEDVFVEVQFEHRLSEKLALNLFHAYLFELSSTVGIRFKVSPRPEIDYSWEEEYRLIEESRLRPLMYGNGMTELLQLYNRAISVLEPDVEILYLTKVIEFVSQTVVRQKATEVIRAKLLSPKALNPDATFVSELETIVKEQQFFMKDREAIKQTVLTCCEASELAKLSPSFLLDLKNLTAQSKRKEQEDALNKFAATLYATRNSIAHAKANYVPTGEEAPESELNSLVACAKVAAEQAIRWYHAQSELSRVV
jgi:hypothetical protein